MDVATEFIGYEIDGEWVVEEAIDLDANDSTGEFFSVPFIVVHKITKEKAFLKVWDVVKGIKRYNADGFSVTDALKRIAD